jgi:hypothetical protein
MFSGKDYFEVAEIMGLVIKDAVLRERLLERQDRRSKAFMNAGDSLLSTIGGAKHA